MPMFSFISVYVKSACVSFPGLGSAFPFFYTTCRLIFYEFLIVKHFKIAKDFLFNVFMRWRDWNRVNMLNICCTWNHQRIVFFGVVLQRDWRRLVQVRLYRWRRRVLALLQGLAGRPRVGGRTSGSPYCTWYLTLFDYLYLKTSCWDQTHSDVLRCFNCCWCLMAGALVRCVQVHSPLCSFW